MKPHTTFLNNSQHRFTAADFKTLHKRKSVSTDIPSLYKFASAYFLPQKTADLLSKKRARLDILN